MKKIWLALMLSPLMLNAQNNITYSSDSVFIKAVSNNVLTDPAPYNDLFYLTKKIGGRLAGSPQLVKAEHWGEETLREAGADSVILEQCMVPHWIRGGTDRMLVFYNDDKDVKQTVKLNVLAIGNSVGSGPEGIKAAVLRVKTFSDLEKHKDEVKGKIVFYDCPFEDTLINTFQAYSRNVIYRILGASRAAKYGAVAVLVRSMTNSPDNNPHTGSLHYIDSFPKIPAVAVGLQDVQKLNKILDKNIQVNAQIFTYGKMLPDTIAHNIIGELIGTEYPGEIITVGGHLDSWDINEGASDDGTGIVQTIEILRAFKALGFKPKHTIQFVLFVNEENGARGAKKYAEQMKANNQQPFFALESDAGGFTPRGFGFTIKPESWQKINNWKNLFLPYGVYQFTEGGDGTDISPLHELFGAPVSELIPDSQRYFTIHHSIADVFEQVNIREMKLGAINMAALLYLIDKYGL